MESTATYPATATYGALDPAATSFEANGIVYTATESLSIARYKIFQRREVEFGFNYTFAAFAQQLDLIWADFNENQRSAAGIQKLGNLRDGIGFAGQNRIVGLEVVGLFFNAPGEDAGKYEHQQMLAKLQAWEDAGLPIGFFFQQSARFVKGFYERFAPLSPPLPAPPSPPPPLPAG